MLDLDWTLVSARSSLNRTDRFGVALVAGFPIGAIAGGWIERWGEEVAHVTNGKVRLRSGSSHLTIASVCRSQPDVDKAISGLTCVDFDRVLNAVQSAESFDVHLDRIIFGEDRSGNIVLVGHTSDTALTDLQQALKHGGLTLKREQPTASPTQVFITLGHLCCGVVKDLSDAEVDHLKQWIQEHNSLDSNIVYSVKELNFVAYRRRTLEQAMNRVSVSIGCLSGMTGRKIREAILFPTCGKGR